MQQQHHLQQSIKLFFPNQTKLWAFAQTLACHNFEVNTRCVSLSCICSTEEINKAFLHYNAISLKEEQEVNQVLPSNNLPNSYKND